jgi:CheY-like chemotaxis protein
MNEMETILLVDDSENDLVLMSLAFKKAEFDRPLQIVYDGEEAIAYLEGDGSYADRDKYPLPGLVLLDLNMPKKNGFEVLAWVRAQPAIRRIPIIILTASIRTEDVELAYDLGANSFLVKPAAIEDLVAMLRCLKNWLQYNHFPPLDEVAVRREQSMIESVS